MIGLVRVGAKSLGMLDGYLMWENGGIREFWGLLKQCAKEETSDVSFS
jgi:hypothetical protein